MLATLVDAMRREPDPKIQHLELLSPEHRHALQTLIDAQLLAVVDDRIILTTRAAVALGLELWEEAAERQLAIAALSGRRPHPLA